jgi:hypothetical protein
VSNELHFSGKLPVLCDLYLPSIFTKDATTLEISHHKLFALSAPTGFRNTNFTPK